MKQFPSPTLNIINYFQNRKIIIIIQYLNHSLKDQISLLRWFEVNFDFFLNPSLSFNQKSTKEYFEITQIKFTEHWAFYHITLNIKQFIDETIILSTEEIQFEFWNSKKNKIKNKVNLFRGRLRIFHTQLVEIEPTLKINYFGICLHLISR